MNNVNNETEIKVVFVNQANKEEFPFEAKLQGLMSALNSEYGKYLSRLKKLQGDKALEVKGPPDLSIHFEVSGKEVSVLKHGTRRNLSLKSKHFHRGKNKNAVTAIVLALSEVLGEPDLAEISTAIQREKVLDQDVNPRFIDAFLEAVLITFPSQPQQQPCT